MVFPRQWKIIYSQNRRKKFIVVQPFPKGLEYRCANGQLRTYKSIEGSYIMYKYGEI